MHMGNEIRSQHTEKDNHQNHIFSCDLHLLIGQIEHDHHENSKDQQHTCFHILIQEEIISYDLINVRELDGQRPSVLSPLKCINADQFLKRTSGNPCRKNAHKIHNRNRDKMF